MMNDRTLELINREIDGLNAPSESQELNSILSSDSSAKKFYNDQQQIAGIFSRVGSVEPPSSIKQNVMNEIHTRGQQRASVSNHASSEANWFHWTSTVRIAVGMAAGILITAIFWPGSTSLPVNDWDVSGTLVARGDQGNVASASLSQSSVTTSISWFIREHDVIFVLSVDGTEPATIRLVSDNGGQIVRTVTRDQAGNCQIAFENQTVVINHVGKNAYTVVVERGSQPNAKIDFELEVGGRTARTTANVIW